MIENIDVEETCVCAYLIVGVGVCNILHEYGGNVMQLLSDLVDLKCLHFSTHGWNWNNHLLAFRPNSGLPDSPFFEKWRMMTKKQTFTCQSGMKFQQMLLSISIKEGCVVLNDFLNELCSLSFIEIY